MSIERDRPFAVFAGCSRTSQWSHSLRIGICGLGTVGSGLFNLLESNRADIERKVGRNIILSQVGCRRDHPDCDLSSTNVTRDIFEVANNPDVDVLVELVGGTDVAKDLVMQAISNGKHIVTANKALIALHGDEVFSAAEQAGVSVHYEAAVAGGIPIVKSIREGLAGNTIEWVAGIINGTTNFILTEMSREGSNRSFDDVLAEAQALGYAEADPTFDVEGIDAAHKLTILAAIAFGVPLNFSAMYTEGISAISADDIKFANELGYCIKHLGIARQSGDGLELRVHPTLVEKDQMLAQVNGVMNAVMVGSDAAGSTMYYGAGAGAGPTASSVMADIIDIVRGGKLPDLGFASLAPTDILPIEKVKSSYCLRLGVVDQAGVMANVSTILSRHRVSIEALIQKDARRGDAQIVILTDEVLESEMVDAISEIEANEAVTSKVSMIRVSNL
ncbi:MAG: homoserine dehydrogenase [Gammaproteobacteria bacterium]|jgi:homoserine dehydrogenase|nr:homoserine dehydrogenase [Gammaproteobacteria bacterium]MBT6890552.1 homoserine dehydrogenase [Gammaproteobacteria bacterium]